jgi:HAD superfamily, subfamily IIIB (Acid phosphatase)
MIIRTFSAAKAAAVGTVAVLFLTFALLVPQAGAAPVGCPAPAPHQLDPTNPINLGQLKGVLRAYRCERYDEEVAAVLARAQSWVEQRAPQVTKPAVVLDIDETSLSNWEQIFHNDFGYISGGGCDLASKAACGSNAWEQSAMAPAIEPTLALFNAAKAKNVAVFFITGRFDSGEKRAATELNLQRAGYSGWDGLYLRDPNAPRPSVAEYKRDARIDVESKGYMIIANIGDQDSDLAFGHAELTFKLPNPFYFIP